VTQEHNLPPLASAGNAVPWCGQWFYIYDVTVLSQLWYDLLFFEDLFARTIAKFSANCRLRNLSEHHAAGPNAQLQLVIVTTWWYQQSIRTSNNYYKQETLSWTVSKLKKNIIRQQKIKKQERKKQRFCSINSTISIFEQTQDL